MQLADVRNCYDDQADDAQAATTTRHLCSEAWRDAQHAVLMFWRARKTAVDDAVRALYEHHRAAALPLNPNALCEAFLDLPCEWPVHPEDFGLTHLRIQDQEIQLMLQNFSNSCSSARTIVDERNTAIELHKLCPFFFATV